MRLSTTKRFEQSFCAEPGVKLSELVRIFDAISCRSIGRVVAGRFSGISRLNDDVWRINV